MKTDIIIPTFNQENFTVKCLESLRAFTKDYRVIWVDNGSTSESRQTVLNELKNHEYLSIWLDKNYGFVKAVNLGLRNAKAEFVILQNNDTEVTEEWLDRLMVPFEKDPLVMATGPLTDAEGSWQGWKNFKKMRMPDFPNLDESEKSQYSAILGEKYKNVNLEVKMLAFFCTVFRKKVFDELGLLDEVYGRGFCDDDDFCHRIRKNGAKVICVLSSFVFHHHRTTFKSMFTTEQIHKMQNDNLTIFKRKYSL